jgi:hypothetical protein
MKRPWHDRAEALFATEGHWADYAAWREWFARETGDTCPEMAEAVLDDAAGAAVHIYVLFCRVADGEATP